MKSKANEVRTWAMLAAGLLAGWWLMHLIIAHWAKIKSMVGSLLS